MANPTIYRKLLGSKIHRATVTQANLEYEGSITIPPELMRAADIYANEAVSIWNVTSGTRLETYAVVGKEKSKDICINGAAAHLVNAGDIVIIACFIQVPEDECAHHKPKVVFVDESNTIREIRQELIETPITSISGGVTQ